MTLKNKLARQLKAVKMKLNKHHGKNDLFKQIKCIC